MINFFSQYIRQNCESIKTNIASKNYSEQMHVDNVCQGKKIIKIIEDKIISDTKNLNKKRKKKITINQKKKINSILTVLQYMKYG